MDRRFHGIQQQNACDVCQDKIFLSDPPRLKTKCCTYPGLKNAQPVKTIVLNHDEEFIGGAYNKGEGEGGFDLIKEVKKKVDRNMLVFYSQIFNIFSVYGMKSPLSESLVKPTKEV